MTLMNQSQSATAKEAESIHGSINIVTGTFSEKPQPDTAVVPVKEPSVVNMNNRTSFPLNV